MRVLLVYCHPLEESFAGALREAAIAGLTASGHSVIDLDLYGEEFNPIMTRRQRIAYADPRSYFKTVEKYGDQLAASDAIVAIYPTWWYGPPAMLKGYFDRVWAPGIAYDVTPDGAVDTHRLAHIRRLGVVTTYGAPWWLIRLYLGDPERKFWSRAVRKLCARDCKLDWHAAYDIDHAGQPSLDRFRQRVRRALASW